MQNETVDIPPLIDGEVVERIDKKDLRPLWEPHEHIYERDVEETDEYYAEVCRVSDCGVGRLVRKA